MAKCYILGPMSNVQQQQHRSMETTANIMSNVDEMFTGFGIMVSFEATYTFMNLRQKKKKGQQVREDMMKVIAYLNELEILEVDIDAETRTREHTIG